MSNPHAASGAKEARRSTVLHWSTLIGAAAAILGTLIALLSYVLPREAGGADQPGTSKPVTRTTVSGDEQSPPPGSSATPGTPATERTHLSALEPVAGVARLVPIPRELEDNPAHDNALVIACASNQTGDEQSEVVYATRLRFYAFKATMYAYRDPPDDLRAELEVFSDPEDRRPGATGGGGVADRTQLEFGQTGEVSATIDQAFYLRLRVVCEKPGGYVILTDASLLP